MMILNFSKKIKIFFLTTYYMIQKFRIVTMRGDCYKNSKKKRINYRKSFK